MNSRDKLIQKIQKLLELSSSPNENEAAQASAKVLELLQQHNLNEAEVRGYQAESQLDLIDVEYHTDIKWSREWEVQLAGVLAEGYFTKVLFTSHIISFIGRPLDVEITRDVFVRVRKVLYDLSFQRLSEYGGAIKKRYRVLRGEEIDLRRLGKGHRSQEYRRGWLQGALEGVGHQIHVQKVKFEQGETPGSVTGRELVLVRGDEIRRDPRVSGAETVQLDSIGDHQMGRMQGQQDGVRTSLHRADLE